MKKRVNLIHSISSTKQPMACKWCVITTWKTKIRWMKRQNICFSAGFASAFADMPYDKDVEIQLNGDYEDNSPWYEFNLSKYRRLKAASDMYIQCSGEDIIIPKAEDAYR